MTQTYKPEIYAACLAAYNNGILHGRWIDATLEPDAIRAEIEAMLAESPIADAEEYAIHDYDDYGKLRLGEYESIDTVHRIALLLKEYGKLGEALLNEYDLDIDEAERVFTDGRYQGCWSSVEDYAQEYIESCCEIPDCIAYYIDYSALARDMQLGGDITALETGYEETHIILP